MQIWRLPHCHKFLQMASFKTGGSTVRPSKDQESLLAHPSARARARASVFVILHRVCNRRESSAGSNIGRSGVHNLHPRTSSQPVWPCSITAAQLVLGRPLVCNLLQASALVSSSRMHIVCVSWRDVFQVGPAWQVDVWHVTGGRRQLCSGFTTHTPQCSSHLNMYVLGHKVPHLTKPPSHRSFCTPSRPLTLAPSQPCRCGRCAPVRPPPGCGVCRGGGWAGGGACQDRCQVQEGGGGDGGGRTRG